MLLISVRPSRRKMPADTTKKQPRGQITNKAEQEFIAVSEAAALLRIHPHTVQRWAREGLIKVIKIPIISSIPRSEFIATVMAREVA